MYGILGVNKVDELSLRIDINLPMVSCLSSNIILCVGWYMDSGDLRHNILLETLC